jgi:small subunit ribosomal protein S17
MVKETKKNTEKEMSKKDIISLLGVAARGRIFEGIVVTKHPKRIAIELIRTVYIPKYERYSKKKTKVHARVPESMEDKVQIGDTVRVQQCRPLSKIIHFILLNKVSKEKKK